MGGCCTKDSSTDTVRSKVSRYERQSEVHGNNRYATTAGTVQTTNTVAVELAVAAVSIRSTISMSTQPTSMSCR